MQNLTYQQIEQVAGGELKYYMSAMIVPTLFGIIVNISVSKQPTFQQFAVSGLLGAAVASVVIIHDELRSLGL